MTHRLAVFTRLALLLGVVSIFSARAQAQDYPARPITLVVPFAAGGSTDIVSRAVAQKLGEALHQTVVVENRPGAGGTLGAALVAKAPADGYTLFTATIAHAAAPGLYKNLGYDFQRDFDPVGLMAVTPNVLLVNPSVPAKTVGELIAYAKAHPGKLSYGSAGKGSTEHLAGELFRSMAKVDIAHIPYKGGAPMMNDLISGQIQMAIETSPSAEPHVRAGKVAALAVTTAKRSPVYPGVPTLDEAGVKGYEMSTWYALVAPHGTPAPVLKRLETELAKVLSLPDIRARFDEQGVTPGDLEGAKLGAFIRAETAKWQQVIKDGGISPD
jgi:tripartite-type tricarboxylate transporter receptor subunit TctC